MKILLLGGTGTLSSDTRKYLVDNNVQTYILNRGTKQLEKSANLHYLVGDINNIDEMKILFLNDYYDVIIDYLAYSIDDLRNHMNIFKGRCHQYVFISSATIFSNVNNERINETTSVCDNGWDYAISKQNCELYLKDNYQNYFETYTIVRPYITYDFKRIPFQSLPILTGTLIYRIKNNKPLIIFGDKNSKTTITSTKDFAIGIYGLLNNEKAYKEDFNITSEFSIRWDEVLDIIYKEMGIKKNYTYLKINVLEKYDKDLYQTIKYDKGNNREFEIKKLQNIVPQFNPKINPKHGISEVVKYYKKLQLNQKYIDFFWDGRMDYYAKAPLKFDKNIAFKNKIKYLLGRYPILANLFRKNH